MVRFDTAKTINASQDKIFSLITAFENLPKRFPGTYQSLKVIERTDNTVTLEEDVTVAGRKIHQITKHTLEPRRHLKSEVLEGDTKGTVVEIMLEPDSDKTKVSVNADLKLGQLGATLGVFARGKIKNGLEDRTSEFEKVVNRMG